MIVNNCTIINQTKKSPLTPAQWRYKNYTTYDVGN